MLKLMKYEFRRMRNVLLILLGALAVLEAGFLIGDATENYTLLGICQVLMIFLVFAVYLYMLISGISGYSRDLNDKTGYMTFMTPVSPGGIVAAKLIYTILSALALTALFGLATWIDAKRLLARMSVNPEDVRMLSRMFMLENGMTASQVLLNIAAAAVNVALQLLTVMCTAYLAITLSATLMRNQRGFLKGLVSVLLFLALQTLTQYVNGLVVGVTVMEDSSQVAVRVGSSAALNLAYCALFGAASAILLDRKVDL